MLTLQYKYASVTWGNVLRSISKTHLEEFQEKASLHPVIPDNGAFYFCEKEEIRRAIQILRTKPIWMF